MPKVETLKIYSKNAPDKCVVINKSDLKNGMELWLNDDELSEQKKIRAAEKKAEKDKLEKEEALRVKFRKEAEEKLKKEIYEEVKEEAEEKEFEKPILNKNNKGRK